MKQFQVVVESNIGRRIICNKAVSFPVSYMQHEAPVMLQWSSNVLYKSHRKM